jgi:hypothetical protein
MSNNVTSSREKGPHTTLLYPAVYKASLFFPTQTMMANHLYPTLFLAKYALGSTCPGEATVWGTAKDLETWLIDISPGKVGWKGWTPALTEATHRW